MSSRLTAALNRLQSDSVFRDAVMQWKTASWTRLFVDLVTASGLRFEGQRVLEPGARDGGLSLFAMEAGGHAVCSDRRHSSSSARIDLHAAWDVRPQYVTADLCDLPFVSNCLDIVLLKSVLGDIFAKNSPAAMMRSLESVRRVLRPGGAILILEQLEGDPLSRRIRQTLFPDRIWHYFAPMELPGLLSGFRVEAVQHETLLSHLAEGCLRSTHPVVSVSLRADRLLERVVPARWTHLVGIVAVKG